MTTKSIQQRAEEHTTKAMIGNKVDQQLDFRFGRLITDAYTAGATDERRELAVAVLEIIEALEAYDFGAGTIGHDTLVKHAELIARLREEVSK